MTDDELNKIELREKQHQDEHEQLGSLLESCEPNGCGEDSDKCKLIAEVKRLREALAEADAFGWASIS